jgi:hypothetical protein
MPGARYQRIHALPGARIERQSLQGRVSGEWRRNAHTASIIEFEIEKRNIHRNGKPATIHVLRVSPYDQQ